MWNAIASLPSVRQTADALFQRYAESRTRRTDRLDLQRVQQGTLLELVHRARSTKFGVDHGFANIRSWQDYQERVPLRTYEEFWSEYWKPAFPGLIDATWPGEIPYLALSSGTTTGATKYVPVSREMMWSNRQAALTALAWFRHAHPRVPLFTGPMFFLGGSTDLKPLSKHTWTGDLSGIAAREVPAVLRPFTFPPLDLALLTDWEQKLRQLSERSACLPMTLVSGVPSWLLVLFEELRRVTGRSTIREIWPQLRLVIHGGTKFDPYRTLMAEMLGAADVHFLETYPASEGFIAAEDPRFRLLRLVPDHGVCFEFVPVDQLKDARPARHTAAEIEPGVQYAVVLTTCAGLWSYVLGDTVCFERRDPPLLRFTGRTRQFLSAFGEHLIGEEVERAVSLAASRTGAAATDFHVGPVFPQLPGAVGHHRFLIEFARLPDNDVNFTAELDACLCSLNEDYRAHRQRDLTVALPEVRRVCRGGFAAWMRAQGKLGGQHKVPRMDNSGQLTSELTDFFDKEKCHYLP